MQRLDIRSIFRLLLSRFRMLLIFAVIFAVLFGAVTYLFVPDTYASGVSVYVSSLASAADKQAASYSSLNSAEWLVLTYAEILQNRVTLQKVLPKLSRHLTEAELAGMVKVQGIEDTAIMRITVTADDPEFAREICDAMAQVSPEVLQSVVGVGSVKVIGKALKGMKTSPRAPRMAVLGALCGMAVAALIVILRYLNDSTIKTESSLKERLGVPVLGTIPSFNQTLKGEKTHA